MCPQNTPGLYCTSFFLICLFVLSQRLVSWPRATERTLNYWCSCHCLLLAGITGRYTIPGSHSVGDYILGFVHTKLTLLPIELATGSIKDISLSLVILTTKPCFTSLSQVVRQGSGKMMCWNHFPQLEQVQPVPFP